MIHEKILRNLAALVLPLLLNLSGKAQTGDIYTFEKGIAVPGDGGYDYLSIDEVDRHLFVSHGTSVNIIDLQTGWVIGSVDNMKGVHGIAIDNRVNKGFITDDVDSNVVCT